MEQPLNVCIISREYPPDSAFGGIARVVQMEARALAAAGHRVHVLTLAVGPERTYVEGGVVVHRLADEVVPLADAAYIQAGLWANKVARFYGQLDAHLEFDVVQNQAYYAEAAHLQPRPETLSVQRLHGLSSVISQAFDRPRGRGQRIFEAMEEAVLAESTELLLAPSQQAADDSLRAARMGSPRVLVRPPFFLADDFPCTELPQAAGPLRLLFLGRLEPLKGPERALEVLAELHRQGVSARLTLVGRDVPQEGRSYRRETLLPRMRELGLNFDQVRFVEQVDADGVRQHLRHCHAVLCPSVYETAHTVTLEAVCSGRSIVTGTPNGSAEWLGEADGVFAAAPDLPDFAQQAAQRLADPEFRRAAARRGSARARELLDPGQAAAAQDMAYREALQAKGVELTPRPPAVSEPQLAIIMLAHNQLDYTQLAVQSLRQTTGCPFRLYLVDNASTDGTAAWVQALGDPRITVLRSEENLGVSGGRNRGLEAAWADDDADYVVFLDNDVELHRGWWQPLAQTLEEDPQAGITGERGIVFQWENGERRDYSVPTPGPSPADMVVGFCMFMRRETTRLVGRYDENLGLFWHDDDEYSFRAARLGYRILGRATGRVHHFEHKSSAEVEGIWSAPETPSELSARNIAYLQGRREFFAGGPSVVSGCRPVALAAMLDELIEDPELLRGYVELVGPEDPVTLLLQTDQDETAVLQQLTQAAEQAGVPEFLELDLLLAHASPEAQRMVGASVDGVWTNRGEVPREYQSPPRFGSSQAEELTKLLRRRQQRIAALQGQLVG